MYKRPVVKSVRYRMLTTGFLSRMVRKENIENKP